MLRHPELKRILNLQNEIGNTINTPEFIVRGLHGEHLTVPYDENGEVRTAFITSDVDRILKRGILWRQP